MVAILSITARISAGSDVWKLKATLSQPADSAFTTLTSISDAKIPLMVPTGIPTTPSIAASVLTLLFIWRLVAPTLASMPYCLIFSVIDMLKLFLIQYTDVSMIIKATTAATVNSALNEPSIGKTHS